MITQRGNSTLVSHGFGWSAKARCTTARWSRRTWSGIEAVAYQCIVVLQQCMAQYIRDDRRVYHEILATLAQSAADRGDNRGTYNIVKKLTGFRMRPPKFPKPSD